MTMMRKSVTRTRNEHAAPGAGASSLVVTGAASGIGHAVAQLAIEQGWRVFGGVKSEEDAKRLAIEFGSEFTPLVFDVRDEDAISRAAKIVHSLVGVKV